MLDSWESVVDPENLGLKYIVKTPWFASPLEASSRTLNLRLKLISIISGSDVKRLNGLKVGGNALNPIDLKSYRIRSRNTIGDTYSKISIPVPNTEKYEQNIRHAKGLKITIIFIRSVTVNRFKNSFKNRTLKIKSKITGTRIVLYTRTILISTLKSPDRSRICISVFLCVFQSVPVRSFGWVSMREYLYNINNTLSNSLSLYTITNIWPVKKMGNFRDRLLLSSSTGEKNSQKKITIFLENIARPKLSRRSQISVFTFKTPVLYTSIWYQHWYSISGVLTQISKCILTQTETYTWNTDNSHFTFYYIYSNTIKKYTFESFESFEAFVKKTIKKSKIKYTKKHHHWIRNKIHIYKINRWSKKKHAQNWERWIKNR